MSGHCATRRNFSATGCSTPNQIPNRIHNFPPTILPPSRSTFPFQTFTAHHNIIFVCSPFNFWCQFTEYSIFPLSIANSTPVVSGLNRSQHPGAGFNKNIQVRLENEDLWVKFNEIGTEMIITKTGR